MNASAPDQHEPADERPDERVAERRVVFVAGAGRSGTSTMSAVWQALGFAVPGPEVVADETNPKGFGEPRWAVDFHDSLLRSVHVAVSDARPTAWDLCAELSAEARVIDQAATWLDTHLARSSDLVVKDPRLAWFLPLWREAAASHAAEPITVTMLRPPAEVVGSKTKHYGGRLGAAHLAASWVNMLLGVESATRADRRAFVRYDDLLADAVPAVIQLGETLDLEVARRPRAEALAQIADFIDPSLRRVTISLSDLDLPPALAELTAETWLALNQLPDGVTPALTEHLDQLRASYAQLYGDAEAISKSTWEAATARTRVEVRRRVTAELTPPPSLWRSISGRITGKLGGA